MEIKLAIGGANSEMKTMTNSLATLLVGMLQDRGICKDDYATLEKAVSDSLYQLNRMIKVGESVSFPNGVLYTKDATLRCYNHRYVN